MNINRQWVLAKRPFGMVGEENFEFREVPIPEPADGQVLVRNLYLSFDPTQRGWMEDRESYLPPVGIGEVIVPQLTKRGVPMPIAVAASVKIVIVTAACASFTLIGQLISEGGMDAIPWNLVMYTIPGVLMT